MRVLGIDPGIALVGYGLISKQCDRFSCVTYGCIRTSSESKLPTRLAKIYKELEELILVYSPSVIAVEKLFFAKNTKTAIAVSHARGVILALGALHGMEVNEYTPNEVKQAVAGHGRAGKQEMQKMVKLQLNLQEIPKPDDVADALAVALCRLIIFLPQYL